MHTQITSPIDPAAVDLPPTEPIDITEFLGETTRTRDGVAGATPQRVAAHN